MVVRVGVAMVVLVAAAVAVLEVASVARLVGQTLLFCLILLTPVAEIGGLGGDAAEETGGVCGTGRAGAAGRTGVPPPAGVAEGETLIGTVVAGTLTVFGVQACAENIQIGAVGVVDTHHIAGEGGRKGDAVRG